MDTSQYTPKQAARFWSKIAVRTQNECWEWTGYTVGGYGRTEINHKLLFSHRVAWILTHGEIPDNLEILHSCDNRACCNPNHLSLGTHKANMEEMKLKGRSAKGERNARHKLTLTQVSYIRARYAQGGISHKELGAEMGVGKSIIGNIIRGENW